MVLLSSFTEQGKLRGRKNDKGIVLTSISLLKKSKSSLKFLCFCLPSFFKQIEFPPSLWHIALAARPVTARAYPTTSLLCRGQDLNLHGFLHTHLKRACLPIPTPRPVRRLVIKQYCLMLPLSCLASIISFRIPNF